MYSRRLRMFRLRRRSPDSPEAWDLHRLRQRRCLDSPKVQDSPNLRYRRRCPDSSGAQDLRRFRQRRRPDSLRGHPNRFRNCQFLLLRFSSACLLFL